jgi:hypothetical protein
MTNPLQTRIAAARAADPVAISFAVVELYNFGLGNGYLVRRYLADGRGANVVSRHGRDEAGAYKAAEMWNSPDAHEILYPNLR